jgi:transcriptional regulator with XRE-family HTH domain
MTQAELAKAVGGGADQLAISRYERGESIPSGPRLQALAKALGCSADDIDLSDRSKAVV